MPDQHGFRDDGTESTRPRQSGQRDHQTNEYDSEVAHSGDGINSSKTTALKAICQFAIDRLPASDFGLPKQRKYPMEDRLTRLRPKSSPTKEQHESKLSPAQARIRAKAKRPLGK